MRSILDVGLTSGSDARERVEALLPPPSRARHLVTRPATFAGPLSSVASIEELWTLPASLHRLVLATQEAGNVTGHITRTPPQARVGEQQPHEIPFPFRKLAEVDHQHGGERVPRQNVVCRDHDRRHVDAVEDAL